jgi:hypothetical protein
VTGVVLIMKRGVRTMERKKFPVAAGCAGERENENARIFGQEKKKSWTREN